MEEILNFFKDLGQNIYLWATTELFTKVGLFQVGALIICLVLSYFFSKFLKKKIKKYKKKKFQTFFNYLHDFCFPILFFILLSIAKISFKSIGWNNVFINTIASILAAWIIIKTISLFFRKAVWFRTFIFIISILALLNILTLLDEFITLLDKIALNIGDLHISLLFVIKGIFVAFIAFWLALKISTFMQMRIGQSKNISPTVGVLLSKITRILFLFIAAILAMNVIGIKLTAFAIFGGAIGVGIGFGLQKIVSNFICGFILLMDKSIKPGDVIEIDDTFGIIQSMSARYITMLTVDGKEHLIPNEDLITQKVINWSHTNRLIRIDVNVGVSYDTDIPKALKIIKEAAKSIKRIYKQNEPSAILSNFGDNSIDLTIKFWIIDPEKGIANIKSDVRIEIWKRFKENNIEIPFPQRDVHVKTFPEFEKK